MKASFDSRKWHIWVSLVLALPILIVSVTAIFIAHNQSLGLRDVTVAANWLPGYRTERAAMTAVEPRAVLRTTAGTDYAGANGGLYRIVEGRLIMERVLAGVPVRALAEAPWGVVVAARNGIWVEQGGNWRRVLKGDGWNAALRADGAVAVVLKDDGIMVSADGQRWVADMPVMAAVAAAAMDAGAVEAITLNKLVMDLHTGKAFFGKAWEWIWIDLVGLAMTLLSLTGVYMWWRGERRKAEMARKLNIATGSAPAAASGPNALASRSHPA